MPVYDYYCTECGAVEEDLYFTVDSKPERRDCPKCGEHTQEHYFGSKRRAQVHHDHSSMYGKYHPGFGMVVESYAHKQQLLRKYDSIEAADPVKGSRSHGVGSDPQAGKRGLKDKIQWADDPKALAKKMDQGAIKFAE